MRDRRRQGIFTTRSKPWDERSYVHREHPSHFEVYFGMRLVCVSRHQYLSEHLCRIFGELGVQCESVVGIAAADEAAEHFEPHLIVVEDALLSPSVLDEWARSRAMRDVPVLAVSLTRRPEEGVSVSPSGIAGVIYLPALDRTAALALMEGARRPVGVSAPAESAVPMFRSPSLLR